MKTWNRSYVLCLLGLPLMACGGAVDLAKPLASDGGAEASPPLPQPESGILADDAGEDAGSEWDGWSAGFASSASGPPPACASAATACGASFPGETAFASSQEAANALVGQWSFCGDTEPGFYAEGQLGEEYAADGKYYELIAGSGGAVQRNMDPAAIGTWAVDLAPNGSLEIHTFGDGVQRNGGLSACPPSLVLLGVESRLP
jgi:hypothetical protein